MHTSTRSRPLQRLIEQQRREAAEIRAKHGDPVEFLGWVVRDGIEADELDEAFRESIGGEDRGDTESDGR